MESFHSHNEELSLKLLIVLSRAFHKVAERIKEDIRSHNLNTTEFAVLELLYHKGDQPIQQIGKKSFCQAGASLTSSTNWKRKNWCPAKIVPRTAGSSMQPSPTKENG